MTHPSGLSSAMNQLPDQAIALAAASHIEKELQITPWNLSSNFVAYDAIKDTTVKSDTIKRFNKLPLRNKDVLDGSWMDRIVWDPNQSVTKPKLLLDLQDEQMLFEILDNKDGDDLQLHAGAMIATRKDIAYFHRPKALWYPDENVVALKEQGKLLTKWSMKIVLKSLGGKGSKLHVDAEETVLSLKGKATKKLGWSSFLG
ncbi:unnamed protein product [Lactuca virosa]|uniref:Uncharacterized protein n=1 Tax=Lactuca virosa TaxID=75947 RepID=A0AAU9LHT9_9ASTR|nr:unnamed protein product [Lactuca virosa]